MKTEWNRLDVVRAAQMGFELDAHTDSSVVVTYTIKTSGNPSDSPYKSPFVTDEEAAKWILRAAWDSNCRKNTKSRKKLQPIQIKTCRKAILKCLTAPQ